MQTKVKKRRRVRKGVKEEKEKERKLKVEVRPLVRLLSLLKKNQPLLHQMHSYKFRKKCRQ